MFEVVLKDYTLVRKREYSFSGVLVRAKEEIESMVTAQIFFSYSLPLIETMEQVLLIHHQVI